MKALAVLKDSLFEAIDNKVFYVLVVMSGLLILFIGSLSFQPTSVEGEFQDVVLNMNRLNQLVLNYVRQQNKGVNLDDFELRYELTSFAQTNDAPEAWNGDYRCTIKLHAPDLLKYIDEAKKKNEKKADEKKKDTKEKNKKDIEKDDKEEDEEATRRQMASGLKEAVEQSIPWLENVEVQSLKSTDDKGWDFVITTKGTEIDDERDWPHIPSLFFGAVPMYFLKSPVGLQVYIIEDHLLNGMGSLLAILVGVIISAFFIPNMLRKGTVDMLLVKPIHRTTLLIYKYIGGLLFVFLNSCFAIGGIWLVIGLRTGIWAPGILVTILVITFFFAVLYAVSVLFGVLTRSAIVSILVTVMAWFGLWIVGEFYTTLESLKKVRAENENVAPQVPEWLNTTAGVIHFVLPRLEDLDVLTTQLLSRQLLSTKQHEELQLDKTADVTWAESLTVDIAFIILLMAISCYWFSTRDY